MPQYSLMAHQTEGVDFLDSVDGVGALLYDPGVGKTGTTLSWIDKMAARHGSFKVLVVAPLTAADTWVLQAPPFMDSVVKARMLEGRTVDLFSKFKKAADWKKVPDTRVMVNHKGQAHVGANFPRPQVTLLSMSSGAISSWCRADDRTQQGKRERTVAMLQAIRKFGPDLIVVDESHLIKAHDSNISEAMYQIGQLAPHRIILTGTVNPHSGLDVYGQWRFMAPWTFSQSHGEKFTERPHLMTTAQARSITPWSWKQFVTRYAEMGGRGGLTAVGVADANRSDLWKRVAERAHVVRKEDALDLPPVTDVDVHIRLTAGEQRVYNEMRDELAAQLDSGELLEAPNPLAKYMKLRQITAGFLRDTATDEVHIVGHSKQKAVAEVVNTTLAGENRIVVFAYFKAEVAAIAQMLSTKGQTVEVVTGATKNADRLAIRQRFADVSGNPGRRILVAQARTMSLSVNELVVAQHAVFASLSERRDDLVQARGRLDRKGQEGSNVTFWNVTAPGTVDEIMLNAHMERGDLEKALLDHIRTTPRNTTRKKAA